MKAQGCRAGQHEIDPTPYSVDAGYLQAADGSRVDGRWVRHRCLDCGHIKERFQPDDPEDPRVSHLNLDGVWSASRAERARTRPASSQNFWERPMAWLAIGLVVLALAVWAWTWDSHIRPSVIKDTPGQPSR